MVFICVRGSDGNVNNLKESRLKGYLKSECWNRLENELKRKGSENTSDAVRR